MPIMSKYSCILMYFIFTHTTLAIHSPENSPSPAPAHAPFRWSPTPDYSGLVNSPSWSPVSPPEYSPANIPPPASPTHAPSWLPMNSPMPVAGRAGVDRVVSDCGSRRMSDRKKAGIAVGVAATLVVVGVAGVVYKKRRNNIQRAQPHHEHRYAPRRDVL